MRAARWLVVASALSLGACGLFGGDDEELEPAELVDIKPKIKVRRAWDANLGGGAEFLRLALRPAGDGNRIYAASADGDVSAFDANTGKRAWRTKLDLALTAGPGVGQDLVVVAAADGYVIALSAETGEEQWRVDIKAESLSTPAVAANAVVIQTVDNRLRGLRPFDGREVWTVNQTMPALTVRGTASPIIVGANVVAGFDNGHVLSVDLSTGDTQWDAMLAIPTGRSDLERLSDVDGLLTSVGQDIYASGYQGRLASIAAESGQILWGLEISSLEGLSADWSSVYTVTDDGVVMALSRRTGAESWRSEILLRREPTLAMPYRTTVVTGDFEGYLHFFNNLDGSYVARVRAGGEAISSPPITIGDLLYVQTDAGKLQAYRIDDPERPERAPDIADDAGG